MSALSQQLLLASLFCSFHSLSSCCVSHNWLQHILKEASNTVKASFAINNKLAFLLSHLLSGSHGWIKLWHQSLWLSASQSLLLATTLLPLLVWSWSHLQHGQMEGPSRNFFIEKWLLVSRPQGNLHLHLQDIYKCDWPWALIWIWKECASQ